MSNIIITNEDCMDLLKRTPDKFYDLAICDPPYGIGISKVGKYTSVKNQFTSYQKKDWDNNIPDDNYFKDLFRVSKNQIIWGGNYFHLPPCPNWIIWDKKQPEGNDFGKYELAYNSTEKRGKIFYLSAVWNNGGDSKNKEQKKAKSRFHPTQKPVALYKWLLEKYAKPGDKILDTHLGSGSIAIACHDYGFDLTACELDKDYFDAAMKRLKDHQNQLKIAI